MLGRLHAFDSAPDSSLRDPMSSFAKTLRR
jgi:hypothetical protein